VGRRQAALTTMVGVGYAVWLLSAGGRERVLVAAVLVAAVVGFSTGSLSV
jgi:hypothetical protein